MGIELARVPGSSCQHLSGLSRRLPRRPLWACRRPSLNRHVHTRLTGSFCSLAAPSGLRNHKLRPDTNVLAGVMLVPDPRAGARDPTAACRARTPDGDTSVGRASAGPGRAGWSPWQTVVGFGVVSLAADMVYEGARSVYGPLLGALGASALVVGAVTGAGEAAALILRVVSGPWADRTRRYWTLTIAGYALTAVCVPLLALTPFLGAAGLAVAAGLILAERIGKAVRSPAKSALLADAAGKVGMGRGLGVHKALDQIGAFAGPLLVAALITAAAGALWPGLAALAVPGAAALGLLVLTRRRMPQPGPGSGVDAIAAAATARSSAALRPEHDAGCAAAPAASGTAGAVPPVCRRCRPVYGRPGHLRPDRISSRRT